MKTLHQILRERLLYKAGISNHAIFPDFEQIAKIQSCPKFECLRTNRMVMGYFRYGPVINRIGKEVFDNISSIIDRAKLYMQDHNREHLVDIANLAQVEFMTHPNYPFNAADDGIHTNKIEQKESI